MMTHKKAQRALRFAREYVVDLNAAQAAIRAGYAPGAAKVQGCRLLRRADVQAEVARLQAEYAEHAGIAAEDVLRAIAQVAFADAAEATRDRLRALELLARHLGLFTKDNEQKGNQGMQALAAAILGNVAGAGGVSLPEGDAA